MTLRRAKSSDPSFLSWIFANAARITGWQARGPALQEAMTVLAIEKAALRMFMLAALKSFEKSMEYCTTASWLFAKEEGLS